MSALKVARKSWESLQIKGNSRDTTTIDPVLMGSKCCKTYYEDSSQTGVQTADGSTTTVS